jgi:ribosome-binding factor A
MDPHKAKRHARIAEHLRVLLAGLLPKVLQWDPLLKDQRISMMDIKLSKDSGQAKIAVLLEGTSQEEKLIRLKHLNAMVPKLRSRLAASLTTKYIPTLRFVLDESYLFQEKMATLFRNLSPEERAPLDEESLPKDENKASF